MKLKSLFNPRSLAASACSIAFLLPLAARADQWDKKTILTVHDTIQIQDRVLEPGQYVLRLMNSNADRHIVQIYNADMSKCIDTILTINDYRMEPTGKSQFRFYETPTGYAKAMKAWFYPGDNYGQEFLYPKHPMMLAMARVAPPPAPMVSMQTETQSEMITPAPEPMPQVQEPVQIAQTEAPPAVAPAPEPAPMPQSNTLPKTASPFPLVGLGGLLFAGAFGLLRLKRA
jgi:hypothetical protein